MSAPRYAIYFTPPPESPLARFGAGILGYDCFEAAEVPRFPVEGIEADVLAPLTVEPARYGFHATLKAPFRLRPGCEAELGSVFASFASSHPAVSLGPLELARIDSFVVLRPVEQNAQIEEFAAACVASFDALRAPLSEIERKRRLAGELSAAQVALLERWGYPYVFNEFRFHMSLAGPVPETRRDAVMTALARAFAPLARDHVEIGAISLMRQDDPAARFQVVSRRRLTGE